MKSSIIRTLFLQVGSVFVVSVLLIAYLWVSSEYENLERESSRYREEFLATQKSILSSEVKKVKNFLLAEKAKAEELLEQRIKQRVEEAYAIADHLYRNKSVSLGESETRQVIVETLRNIRFNQGRGYYFITSLNGIEHLFPPNPSFEGKHASAIFSTRGVKVVEDMVEIAKKQGEGFLRYAWPRPDDQTRDYQKYSYVKLFEPYGWIIGTGDYLEQFEDNIKQDIFKQIANIKYGLNDEGYFFINSYQGDLYVTNGQYFGGEKNIWGATDVNGIKVVQENARLAQSPTGGGFSRYVWKKPSGIDAAKIAYVEGMDEWNLFIGTGTYIDTIEGEIERREQVLEQQLTKRLLTAVLVLLATTLIIGIAMYLIARKLSLNFAVFQEAFEKAAKSRVRIDPQRVFFSEFRAMADRTNLMIDALNQQAERLRHQAHHDHLTALPNRVKGVEYLAQMIDYARQDGVLLALLFIDVDDFKEVNDTLGHTVGDRLLQVISDRLLGAIREEDAVARLGGDEFTVITGFLHQREDAGVIAEKLLKALQEPFLVDDYRLHISVSIGISLFPNDGEDAEAMLRNADSAMYHAKRSGKNNYIYYHDDMTQQAAERVEMLDSLRQAIQEDQFELYYQPQLDTRGERVLGVEALLRWKHPERGFIPPDQFIPFSESSGQILAIGEWVLRTACRQMARWCAEGIELDFVAVNISGKQLQRQDLPGLIKQILQETELPADKLELEITESLVMDSPSSVISDLEHLKRLGVRLSIDDFGTGHSSLSHLKQLPIEKLKIDRAFINDLDEDEDDRAIVRAVIALGKSLALDILAEGVERPSQMQQLATEGCHLVQGFYFSKPLPTDELLQYLKSKSCEAADIG